MNEPSLEPTRIRIFVSSPGDVTEERVIAGRVIARLAVEYEPVLRLEGIFWEHEPLRASAGFQTQLPPPSEADIVICILWSRLGTRLPADLKRPDGSRYASGTEYEFENALDGWRLRHVPDLLVYRKTAEPLVSLRDRTALDERLSQMDALDAFVNKWFHDRGEGTLIAAFHPFEDSSRFEELLEIHLRKLIERRLPSVPNHDRPLLLRPTWTAGSPYRGLAAFDFEHAPVFFGRSAAVAEVLRTLRLNAADGRAFEIVFGASGSGKSSLVRAGVLPLLTQPGVIEGVGIWRRAVCVPSLASGDLFDGLAAALLRDEALPELAADGTTASGLAAMMRKSPGGVAMLIKGGLSQAAAQLQGTEGLMKQPDARLALVLDQLEEIFTLERVSAGERSGLASVLRVLAESGRVWVLATLRSDFYGRCEEVPELLALKAGGRHFHLAAASPAEIGAIVRRPAEAAGLRFEEAQDSGERLDEVIRDAAAAHPESLPLVEFALDQLYRERRSDGLLTIEAYWRLGGLEGAIARHAEETFSRLAGSVRAALPAVLSRLVAVHAIAGEGATARRAGLADLPGAEARELVRAFVDARLFATGQADDGTTIVMLAHEALIVRWPRLSAWLAENRDLLRSLARVAGSASRWEEEGRRADLLLPEGKPLADGLDLVTRLGAALEPPLAEYVRLSSELAQERREMREAEAARALRRARVTAAVFALLAVVAIAGMAWGFLAQRSARRALAANQVRYAMTLLAADRQDEALAYLASALRLDRADMAAWSWTCRLLQRAPRTPIVLSRTGSIGPDAFSPDGDWMVVVCNDSTAQVFSVLTGAPRGPPLRHRGEVLAAGFSTDGRWVVTASGDSTARIWEAATSRPTGQPMRHGGPVYRASFSPDGRRVISACEDSTARLWDAATCASVGPPMRFRIWPVMLAKSFSPNSRFVVVGSISDPPLIWDAVKGTSLGLPARDYNGVRSSVFSPDGRTILSTNDYPAAFIWNAFTPRETGPSFVDSNGTLSAEFSPDGRLVVTTSQHRSASVWDAATGVRIGRPMRHDDQVNSAVFSPDGRSIVTASRDGTARIWDASTGDPISQPMRHESEVNSARFSPDGRHVATSSEDGTVRIWDATTTAPACRILRHENTVLTARFTGDGKHVVTTTRDGTLQLWDAVTGARAGRWYLHAPGVIDLADGNLMFSPDGCRAVVSPSWISRDSDATQLVDVATGRAIRRFPTCTGDFDPAAFSPDGRRVVLTFHDSTARIWDTATGASVGRALRHKDAVRSARFSSDGRRVVTASHDSTARIWDAATGIPIGKPLKHEDLVFFADFSRDGRRVVTISLDYAADVWDCTTGVRLGRPLQHQYFINSACFSPDGRRVVTASDDATARIWDVATGSPVGHTMWHGGDVNFASFSPDGRRVVTVASDSTARIWDAATGDSLSQPLRHEYYVLSANFSPDGRLLVTASSDGTARVWNVFPPAPADARRLADLAEVVSGLTLTSTSALISLPDWNARLLKLRHRAGEAKRHPSDVDLLLHWIFANPATRTVSPLSKTKVSGLEKSGSAGSN